MITALCWLLVALAQDLPVPAAVEAPPEVEILSRRPGPVPAVESVPIFEYGPPAPVEPVTVVVDFVGPVEPPVQPQPIVEPPSDPGLPAGVLPWVAVRGFFPGALLWVVTLLLVALAEVLRRLQAQLAPHGLLPDAARVGGTGARVLAAAFGLGALAAWVPANVAPALPWIFVGGAVAVGWSARDLLPDAVAWAVMLVEGRVRPGRWVSGEGFRGEVQSVGLRATVVLDAFGGEVSLPNRFLVRAPYARDPSIWPKVEVCLVLPVDLDAAEARSALREAVQLSPWIAPGPIDVRADTEGSGRWSVSARLLEGTYMAAFEGSLRERFEEVLAARRRS